MSALSLLAFDRYIQPSKTSSPSMDESSDRKPPFSFYPPLYVTPAVPTPRPPSPSPSSPSLSPYVVNFKRRGPLQSARVENEARIVQQVETAQTIADESLTGDTEARKMVGDVVEGDPILASTPILADDVVVQAAEKNVFAPKITNPRPKIVLGNGHMDHSHANGHLEKQFSAGSNNIARAEDIRFTSPRTSTTSEEFFDAPEAPLDDSASEDEALCSNFSTSRSFERLTPRLQEEIARRIRAEESVASLQRRWDDMARKYSLIRSMLPLGEGMLEVEGGKEQQDVLEQLSHQEVIVARLVGGAIARAVARAEKDEELESMLAGKNREISRLWDKLQYVELVNREISQRNQEGTERAQRRRQRRRIQRRWVVGCFCTAFCVGTVGLLCYKFVPWDQARLWSKEAPKVEPTTSEVLIV